MRLVILLLLCACGEEFATPLEPGVYYVKYIKVGSCQPPDNNLVHSDEWHGEHYIKWVVSRLEDDSFNLYRPGYNGTDFSMVGYEQGDVIEFSGIQAKYDTWHGFNIRAEGYEELTGSIEVYESDAQHGVQGCVASFEVKGEVAKN